MTSNLVSSFAAALAAAGLASAAAAQTVVTIQPDRDTTLYEDPTGSLANGGGAGIFIGRVGVNGGGTIRRALVHFDVAGAVPAGAVIVAADLELFSAQSAAFLPITTAAHRVLQDWSEGSVIAPGQGGAGGASAAGESTWLHRNFPNVLWNNPGGDFAAAASFTFPLPGIGAVVTDPLPGLIADVRAWRANPAANFGWLLKTDELQTSTARRVNSREATAQQPALTITYLMPGDTGRVGDGWPVNGGTFDLDVVGVASSGTTLSINYTNAPATSVGANFLSIGVNPLGTPLLPGCTCNVYLPLTAYVPGDGFLTSATGAGGTTWTIPPASPGFLVAVQAAVLDPASPIGFSLSNAGVFLTQ